MTSPPGHRHLLAGLRISYVAVVWSVVAGAVSITVGIRSHSTALVGTGTDVVADMLSSVVLIWRFRTELLGGRPGAVAEARAQVVAAGALLVVAVGVAVDAVVRLVAGHGASATGIGVATASASLVVLPVLAVRKVRIARRIPSPALRTDGLITFVGAATAAASLVGLVVTRTTHSAAADPVAALVIAVLAGVAGVRELASGTT